MGRLLQLLGLILAGLVVVAPIANGAEQRVQLTAVEQAWIEEHPVVHFGYDPSWGPFSYRDKTGNIAGIDREFLDLLEERLGLRFLPVHSRSWPEAYEGAKGGASDFLVGTAENERREQDFLFTRPYNSFPMAFVARYDSPVFISMGQLKGKRVALVEGYVGSLMMEREHPEVRRVMVKTMEDAFLAVAADQADVALTNIANANYVIRALGLANLKVAGVVPYLFELRYAVRKDRPVLRDILDKGVASLTAQDRQKILSPWVSVEYARVIRWDYIMRWVLGGIAVVGAFVGVMVLHNRRLRFELGQRTRVHRELEQTKRRLEALNEEKSGLMRMAAHDLRSPLAGLMINIELLTEKSAPADREPLDRMMAMAHQMIHMIHNLLDVQALEDGRRRLNMVPLDLTKEVEEGVAGLRSHATRKRIVLATVFEPAAPPALADQAALQQVLNNLLSNAVKYSPFDRVVTVEVKPGGGGKVVLSVRDQGPGIAADEMPRLFQKYACLSSRPTGGEQSTGLGLAIVRQLVVAMGGTVRCESAPDEGTVFIVELQAAPVPVADGRAEFKDDVV